MFYDKPILDSKGEEIKLGAKVMTGSKPEVREVCAAGLNSQGRQIVWIRDTWTWEYADKSTIAHPDTLTELEGSLSYGGNDAHIRGILGIPIDGVQRSPSVYISRTIAITKRGVLERLKSHFEETVQYGRCVENDGSHCFMTPIDDTCCPYNWDIDKILEAIDHE